MSRLFESVYIAVVMILIGYYLIEWMNRKIRRSVEDELYFQVAHEVDCNIMTLIDTGVLETTEEYKKDPDKFRGPRFGPKIKKAKVVTKS